MSRRLYVFIKAANVGVIAGLLEFASFFVSDEIAGPDGPLAAYGLASGSKLAATQAKVSAAGSM